MRRIISGETTCAETECGGSKSAETTCGEPKRVDVSNQLRRNHMQII